MGYRWCPKAQRTPWSYFPRKEIPWCWQGYAIQDSRWLHPRFMEETKHFGSSQIQINCLKLFYCSINYYLNGNYFVFSHLRFICVVSFVLSFHCKCHQETPLLILTITLMLERMFLNGTLTEGATPW